MIQELVMFCCTVMFKTYFETSDIKWRLRFVFVILFVCVWVRILWCINVVVCLHTECAEPRLTGSKAKQTWWLHGSMIRVPLGRCNRVWRRVNWFLLHYVGHVWLTSTCTLYWMSRLWILRLFRCVNRRGARLSTTWTHRFLGPVEMSEDLRLPMASSRKNSSRDLRGIVAGGDERGLDLAERYNEEELVHNLTPWRWSRCREPLEIWIISHSIWTSNYRVGIPIGMIRACWAASLSIGDSSILTAWHASRVHLYGWRTNGTWLLGEGEDAAISGCCVHHQLLFVADVKT